MPEVEFKPVFCALNAAHCNLAMISEKRTNLYDRLFDCLALFLIAAGILLRIAVFLQNRNLFIDEANVARNIFERNFLQLATPLSYEQYAPPVFLWMVKLSSFFFGYGEMALRLYPLLSSFAALILFFLILRQLGLTRTLWYPLALMVVGYLTIRYATELKQYMSDATVVLGLLYLALRIDLFKLLEKRFFLIWLGAGSLAIWAAMPAVFALAGVGVYYIWPCLVRKDRRKLFLMLAIGVAWLLQFILYYFLILRPQIESSYLQNFHQDYFLYALPDSKAEWKHNWNRIKELIEEAAGYEVHLFYFHLVCMIIGVGAGIYRLREKTMLFVVPLAAVLCAAALNQYSLIPRVALFTVPLLLVLLGLGLDVLCRANYRLMPLVFVPVGFYGVYAFSSVKMAWQRFESEEITDAMSFVIDHQINHGKQLYVSIGSQPAFIYYTQIHPDNSRWERLKDAQTPNWDADYANIGRQSDSVFACIFTSISIKELKEKKQALSQLNRPIASLEKQGCYVYLYHKR